MIVIVGHGPSALWVDGSWLDQQTVIRLKHPKVHPGTRTDYYCSRSNALKGGEPFWHFKKSDKKWMEVYRRFSDMKPSTGLCAMWSAIDHLGATEIGLAGFDDFWARIRKFPHDFDAEYRCAHSLLKVVNVSEKPSE